jgi:hypothetical protein
MGTETKALSVTVHQSGDSPDGTLCGFAPYKESLLIPGSPWVTCWLCLAVLNGFATREQAQAWVLKQGRTETVE